MNKGFGIIGLLITLVIIGVLVWGAWYINGDRKQNQVQQGQSAIDAAKDAAESENNYNSTLLEDLDAGGGVNYRAATNGLK